MELENSSEITHRMQKKKKRREREGKPSWKYFMKLFKGDTQPAENELLLVNNRNKTGWEEGRGKEVKLVQRK